ncbi:alpha/beta fold hydrolase [Exiguobacterium sp. BRG2]|uniref:alpha/beta hydrolase n=1 Tax=Exiguobacterium sp. BRG2 TaxID=2962584 RepID=UPI002881B50A|nr:alpha/beta fold hydrolase [Exiguobacterium sp. BRG2]MDT0173781.1 alpha/beta fold hydrolase [Exiguobacterium sp. BRG2]
MITKSKDLYLEGTGPAILLLHSFTGSANEMRGLARFLHVAGYTCYAPNYAGHGESPERLFETTIEDVWQSAQAGLAFLQDRGHKDIFLIGQSLGGVMALRLAEQSGSAGLILLSTPILERTIAGLEHRVRRYTERYFQFDDRSQEWIADFVDRHFPRPEKDLRALQQFILDTGIVLPKITQPIALFLGALDDVVYQASLEQIETTVPSRDQKKVLLPNSKHLLTLDRDKQRLFDEILVFLKTHPVDSLKPSSAVQ